MKIGIIKETKTPVDNRVALSPDQIIQLKEKYKDAEIVVQSSDIRAFSDDEYRNRGIQVVENVDDCDVLFGIKEAKIDSLIPNKHYFFFGHIAKMQEYNRPLLQAFLKKSITFSDYEYLVDDNQQRLCAFGWWAGVVGVYYTLQGYGLRTKKYTLPKPDIKFTVEQLKKELKNIKLPGIKILITGNGRVSHGAQFILDEIGAKKLNPEEYLEEAAPSTLSYFVATTEMLVKNKQGNSYSHSDFKKNPQDYESVFSKWALAADIYISCHFWASGAPAYLTKELMQEKDFKIKMVGDITCDINGSVECTIRASTHAEPFYDYNPITGKEEPAFSSNNNITVMAVDTCPNALAIDASTYFGDMLSKYVFEPLIQGKISDVIDRATIVKNGELTPSFSYLDSFAKEK